MASLLDLLTKHNFEEKDVALDVTSLKPADIQVVIDMFDVRKISKDTKMLSAIFDSKYAVVDHPLHKGNIALINKEAKPNTIALLKISEVKEGIKFDCDALKNKSIILKKPIIKNDKK